MEARKGRSLLFVKKEKAADAAGRLRSRKCTNRDFFTDWHAQVNWEILWGNFPVYFFLKSSKQRFIFVHNLHGMVKNKVTILEAEVDMRNKPSKIIISAFFFLALSACSYDDGQEHKESDSALLKRTSPPPIELKQRDEDESVAFQVKKEVSNIDEIYDVAVVEGDKKIIVAYKVKHMKRFRMKKIERELTKKLKKEYPDEKFIVSSDYKIFLEAVRLKEDLDGDNLSNAEAKKRFKKIIRLKEEMT